MKGDNLALVIKQIVFLIVITAIIHWLSKLVLVWLFTLVLVGLIIRSLKAFVLHEHYFVQRRLVLGKVRKYDLDQLVSVSYICTDLPFLQGRVESVVFKVKKNDVVKKNGFQYTSLKGSRFFLVSFFETVGFSNVTFIGPDRFNRKLSYKQGLSLLKKLDEP